MLDCARSSTRPLALLTWMFLLAACGSPALAQTAAKVEAPPPVADSTALNPGPWGADGKIGAAMTQSSYTSNWRGGDTGSFAWALRGDFSAERQFSTGFNWSNRLVAAFGQTGQQERVNGSNELVWKEPLKSTDLLRFESVARWTGPHWANPYIALGAETQFLDQSNPTGTIHMNPIKLRETAGMAHVFRNSKDRELITRLGAGLRETLARSFVNPPSLETASFTATDGGFEWETKMLEPLAGGRITYRSRLLVFAPVFYSRSDALKQYDADMTAVDPNHVNVGNYWRVPDVDWTHSFSTKVTKAISVDLFLEFAYDKFDTAANVDNSLPLVTVLHPEIERNTRLAGQFKQTLALGISTTLF